MCLFSCIMLLFVLFFRLGYAVFLIQLLLKENKNDKIHVSYDIACMLKRHIEVCVIIFILYFNAVNVYPKLQYFIYMS